MDAQSSALLAHIISQTHSNIDFLLSQNYLSQADASAILAKLPDPNNTQPTHASPPTRRTVPPVAIKPAPRVVQARALWAYNENGQVRELVSTKSCLLIASQEIDDLSFSQGNIIEIVEETNADWWLGKFNNKQALFPSAYVEKIPSTAMPSPTPYSIEKPVYKPFMAAHHGADTPPPAQSGETNSVGLQQDPAQEAKKSKFGGMKNTMAHSAAGGVGFGAGVLLSVSCWPWIALTLCLLEL